MTTYILLLRGVMPSGKNKVPMAQLRDMLVDAGFGNVRTYIQSGNALVDTELSALETESLVHELIQEHIGPDLAVVARTSTQVQQVLRDNPFQEGYQGVRPLDVFAYLEPDKAYRESGRANGAHLVIAEQQRLRVRRASPDHG